MCPACLMSFAVTAATTSAAGAGVVTLVVRMRRWWRALPRSTPQPPEECDERV